jgi:protein TonB
MHAAHSYNGSGSKITKIAIVTALHVGIALALISIKVIDKGPLPKPVDVVFTEDIQKIIEPDPVKPNLETPKTVIDKIVVPQVDFDIKPPEVRDVVRAEPPGPGKTDEGERGLPPGPGGGTKVDVAPPADKFTVALANASDCVRPDYPARSVRNGDSGTVNLALLIGVDGRVTEAKVQKSSGHRELDRAAVDALSMCKFKPATRNGVAQPAWGQLAYVWSLD